MTAIMDVRKCERAIASLFFAGLALATFASNAFTSVPTHGRARISGVDYVQVDDWARSRNFTYKWIVPREEMRLSNSSFSVLLNTDSRKVSLSGIQLWLSFPVACRNGTLWISSLDLATVLDPILLAPRANGAKKITTICLDPGHGGKDPGNREGRQLEKNYTLLLAKEARSALTKAGFKVLLTRSSDRLIDLGDRPRWAKQKGADLFISLHFNSADGPGGAAVKGVEVYCLAPAGAPSTNSRGEGATGGSPGNRFDGKNMHLAYQLQKSLVRQLDAEDRGVKRARYAVLRMAEIPAVLIEGGFMTHPTESKKIYSAAYRQQMAQAITDATLAYKKAVEQ